MKRLICLFLFSLLAGPTTAPTIADDVGRLDPNVRPTFEAVRLRIDPEQTEFSGSVTIEIVVAEPTQHFRFNAEDLTIDRIEIAPAEAPVEIEFMHSQGLVEVQTSEVLPSGPYTLQVEFHGPFNTQAVGLYRMVYQDKGYLFTQFEADDARRAFPCWDEPEYKIPYQLTLIAPEGHLTVTNTPLASSSSEAGWTTWVFQKTKPLPSYLLAIAAGPLETVPITGLSVPGKIVTVTGQSHLTELAIEMTPPILAALEAYFDQPYPYQKLDYVAIPEYWPGAMEHPGAVTFADNILLLDPQAVSTASRRRLARIIAHELAHMWFGDLVTMTWWDDLWLNESFADWLGDKITDEVYPELELRTSALAGAVQGVMRTDARPSTPAIRQPVDSTDSLLENVGIAYNKGKTLLGMVERWIGPEVFRSGVLTYIERHEWGNTVASDLWTALSEAADRDLEPVLSAFLDQPGYPLISVEPTENGLTKLAQKRFLNQGIEADSLAWQIPIGLKYRVGDEIHSQTVLLQEAKSEFKIEGDAEWIMPNADGAGYYRWQVPPEMLRRIAADASAMLNSPERVTFLGNAAALMSAGALSGGDYLDILGSFASDPDPQVMSAAVSGLDNVKQAFVPAELEKAYGAYLRRTLNPALDQIGLEPQAGESETASLLRPRLIDRLGAEGSDPVVLEHARDLANRYVQESGSVDPSVLPTALRLNAIGGDRSLFDRYRSGFESAQTPVERGLYLSALGNFRDPELIKVALEYVFEGTIRPTELFTIPMQVAASSSSDGVILDWIMNNYDEIVMRLPAMYLRFLPFTAGGCSLEVFDKGKEFFTRQEIPGVEQQLIRVGEQVRDCANLRSREGDAVRNYLLAASPAE